MVLEKQDFLPELSHTQLSKEYDSHLDLRLGGRQSRIVPTRWRLTESELEQTVRIIVLTHSDHMTSEVKVDARSAGARRSVLAIARRHGDDGYFE